MNVTQVGESSVIAAIGNGSGLQYYWQPIDATGWNPEQVSASNLVSASVAQVGNSSVIAAAGFDGSLWFYWQTIGGMESRAGGPPQHDFLGIGHPGWEFVGDRLVGLAE
jgi:hypothetical protein